MSNQNLNQTKILRKSASNRNLGETKIWKCEVIKKMKTHRKAKLCEQNPKTPNSKNNSNLLQKHKKDSETTQSIKKSWLFVRYPQIYSNETMRSSDIISLNKEEKVEKSKN